MINMYEDKDKDKSDYQTSAEYRKDVREGDFCITTSEGFVLKTKEEIRAYILSKRSEGEETQKKN